MATFFRTTGDPNDLRLLSRDLRDDAERDVYLAHAEAEVLALYTVAPPAAARFRDGAQEFAWATAFAAPAVPGAFVHANGVAVCLRGFDPDPDACEPLLADAIRRTVADVARWWGGRLDKEPLLKAEGVAQQQTNTYRDDAEHPLPPTVGRHLAPYDVRPPYEGL